MSAGRILDGAREAGRSALLEPEGKALLSEYGVKVPRFVVAHAEDQLQERGRSLRPPLALKVISPEALHKSDVGGVRLNLQDLDAACLAMAEMRLRLRSMIAIEGFLLEEMAPSGHEIVVGGELHPQFGPVIMVGLGGVLVEVLDDIALRLCPIDEDEARAMLAELRAAAILDGARGREKANSDAIVDVLLKMGGPDGMLIQLCGELAEVDINPLIVGPTEAAAVDARVILARKR